MKRPSYLAAAFNARPFGMPIPPNWLALAAVGMLGAFLNPGFWLIGAGLELAYLWALTHHPRFRATVEARVRPGEDWDRRYREALAQLDAKSRRRQEALETRCSEIVETLAHRPGADTHTAGLTELCWLHLRLLTAQAALARVAETASRESVALAQHEDRIVERLGDTELDAELRRSLEQQKGVIDARQDAHQDAVRRLEHVDAELERIDQQVSLIREQALLATDEGEVARSVDALTASLNESNRWLQDQRELFAALDPFAAAPPPADLLTRKRKRSPVSGEDA